MFSLGKIWLNPLPKTAIVFPHASRAPICAAVSIPTAIPLTIVIPCFAKSKANFRAFFAPSSEQHLEPIIDIAHEFNKLAFPSTNKTSGGFLIFFNNSG